jgi:hypothetical protein
MLGKSTRTDIINFCKREWLAALKGTRIEIEPSINHTGPNFGSTLLEVFDCCAILICAKIEN